MMAPVQIVLLFILGIPAVYLGFLSFLALIKRRSPFAPAKKMRKLAVIVPAHNEELVLAATLRSLRDLDYPREKFDIMVVADNCNDRTAAIARAEGALVYERFSLEKKGKGAALRWGFDRLPRDVYEGVVVCDADMAASPNLLQAVNQAFDNGAEAVQCNDQVRPSPGSWSAEATRAGFLLYNYARPMGRAVMGCSAGLRGTGMAFTTTLLRDVPWEAFSRAEDLEYGLQLLLAGHRVVFVHDASVVSSMPVHAGDAEIQRSRWEGGRFPIIKRYAWPLLREAFRTRKFALCDALIDLLTPPFVTLMLVNIAVFLTNVLLWVLGVSGGSLTTLLWAAVVTGGMLHALLGFAAAGSLRDIMKLIRFLPTYAFWKTKIYVRLLFRGGDAQWVRTVREGASTGEGS